MEVTITPNELIELGLWEKFCDLWGINVWTVNEGLMESDRKLTMSEDDAKALGLIKK